MSTPRLLPGPSGPELRESERFAERHWIARVAELEKSNEDLRRQVTALDEEILARNKQISQLERSLDPVRRQMLPWYQALCALFGEFDKAFPNTADAPNVQSLPPPQSSNFWETQKRRFPGRASDIIDLLLERSMSVMQIVAAGRMDRHTVYNHIRKLTKAGLVRKDGGIFSLQHP